MFLIDTNCWIQLVRQRPLVEEVNSFLVAVPTRHLFTTIYSVHGVGVIMNRHGMLDRYGSFLSDMSIGSKLNVISVPIQSLGRVADAAVALRLDFDDAYQYIAAELNDLRIVSLDADFDRTPRGRLTPAAALQLFKDEKQRPQQDA